MLETYQRALRWASRLIQWFDRIPLFILNHALLRSTYNHASALYKIVEGSKAPDVHNMLSVYISWP